MRELIIKCYEENDGIIPIYKFPKDGLNIPIVGEVIRCKDCIWFDPPHVEKDGQRYEYFEFEEKAFNKLVPQMVHAEYGVNVGGRCVREFYIGNLENKDIFRNENDFCSKAERREE